MIIDSQRFSDRVEQILLGILFGREEGIIVRVHQVFHYFRVNMTCLRSMHRDCTF